MPRMTWKAERFSWNSWQDNFGAPGFCSDWQILYTCKFVSCFSFWNLKSVSYCKRSSSNRFKILLTYGPWGASKTCLYCSGDIKILNKNFKHLLILTWYTLHINHPRSDDLAHAHTCGGLRIQSHIWCFFFSNIILYMQ